MATFKDMLLANVARGANTSTTEGSAIRDAAVEAAIASYSRKQHRRTRTGSDAPVEVDEVDQPNSLNSRGIEAEMVSHYIPTKKKSKRKTKLTKNTQSSFNAQALKGVPGASQNASYASIAQMYEEGTGCLVVDDDDSNQAVTSLYDRLSRSHLNTNTTKGNYIV